MALIIVGGFLYHMLTNLLVILLFGCYSASTFAKDVQTKFLFETQELVRCAAVGDGTCVNRLLKPFPALLNKQDDLHQQTALFASIANKQFDISSYLLEHNAEVNLSNQSQVTPILVSIANNDLPAVKALFQKGADVNFQPQFAPNAAVLAGLFASNDLLIALNEMGLNFNKSDSYGNTALSAAKLANRTEAVNWLTTNTTVALFSEKNKKQVRVQNKHLISQKKLNTEPVISEGRLLKNNQTVFEYPKIKPEINGSDSSEINDSVYKDLNRDHELLVSLNEAYQSDKLIQYWNQLQLSLLVKHKVAPTRAARGLALLHVAIWDALVKAQEDKLNFKVALNQAAAQVLTYLYPSEEQLFLRLVYQQTQLLKSSLSSSEFASINKSQTLGIRVGQQIVSHALQDGAQKGWNGLRLEYYGQERNYTLGSWQATPPYFYFPPDEPFAKNWKLWVLQSPAAFRPTPPAFMSPKFIRDLKEVLSVNQKLTDEQLKIAKFWVDGRGTVTPAGHWNQIALSQIHNSNLSQKQIAQVLMVLNITLADTFIATWDTKYYYWTMRPVTAAKQILGQELNPAILTPAFPSYVSGHAANSAAAAKILGYFFPKKSSELMQMAKEVSESRLYGGIHFRHDNEDGYLLGVKVAQTVLKKIAQ